MRRKYIIIKLIFLGLFVCWSIFSCRSIIYNMIEPKNALLENVPVPEGLSELSAKQCGACHQEIYKEWSGSMHAQAWTDPLFQHDFEHQGKIYVCTYCHTPVGQQRELIVTGLETISPLVAKGIPNKDFDPELQKEGVTCVGCHLREGNLRGPHALEEGDAPHPFIQDKTLSTPETCKPCHDMGKPVGSDLRRPILETYTEWDEYLEKGGTETCLDCHMPAVERSSVEGGPVRTGRRHVFRGGHDKSFVKSSLTVKALDIQKKGKNLQAQVVVFNQAGHRLPTAEPARRIEITFSLLDVEENVLSSITERIERVIIIPGYDEVSDNTLLPMETRSIRLSLDGQKEAAMAKISIRYFLWEPTSEIAKGIPESDLITDMFEKLIPL